MRIYLVNPNLMLDFQEKFDILFEDPEFGLHADKKLVSQIVSSLTYEYFDPGENIVQLDVISSGIYFIQKGSVTMYHMDCKHELLHYDAGSYIGDTSYIFQIKNRYKYILDHSEEPNLLYSL